MYYDITNIPEDVRKESCGDCLVSLYKSSDPSLGQGLPMTGLSVALDGDSNRGIVSAIEDFLKESDGWQYISIPAIFGLGVLISPVSETSEVGRVFTELGGSFERFAPFLSIIEFNRISLLEKINYMGSLWHQQQRVINEYADNVDLKSKAIDDYEIRVDALVEERETLRKRVFSLESHVNTLSLNDDLKSKAIDDYEVRLDALLKEREELRERVSSLEKYVDTFSTFAGWVKNKLNGNSDDRK